MRGSIAPNRPGHHGTVVARTVGTVAISCRGSHMVEHTEEMTLSLYIEFHRNMVASYMHLRYQMLKVLLEK